MNKTPLRHLLVPFDTSPSSRAAVARAAALAEAFDADIDLLAVSHVPQPLAGEAIALGDHFVDADIRRRREDMDAALEQLAAQGVRARGQVALGFAADVIIERANSGAYDGVVMGTRGLTGLSYAWSRSIAGRVVRESVIPVFTVHAPASA
jgi:nucleotide-binding universal stress UspA family protein